jgi:predicted RNase H-like nuclease (RuvC/YqgF family)
MISRATLRLVTDANHARIFVFGLGETLETEQVKGKKVQRVKVGGWSQARYQRRVENAHASHAKSRSRHWIES